MQQALGRARRWLRERALGTNVCAALLWLLASEAFALDDDGGLWFTLNLGTKLAERLNASLILQPRFDDDVGRFERLVVRPGLHWQATQSTTLTQGYDAHIIDAPNARVEHRLWQEIAWSGTAYARFTLLSHARLEWRFIEHVQGPALRPRLLVGGRYRLDEAWALQLTNEVFLNINDPDGITLPTFDQNRLIAGFLRSLGPGRSALLGYQAQYINHTREDLLVHQAFLGLTFRF